MTEMIAGVEIPAEGIATEATRLVRDTSSSLLYHHSRRVFLFGTLHARALGLTADPELLYLASMFHDTGLSSPFWDSEQRFEIDGADQARRFLGERGYPADRSEVVWSAIALHTTPGIPSRMGPEIAATHLGVLTDAIGVGLDALDPAAVDEITAAHPRGRFKQEFLAALHEGLRGRPDTTYGTVNADVLEHFEPGFRRTSMVERILHSPWAA